MLALISPQFYYFLFCILVFKFYLSFISLIVSVSTNFISIQQIEGGYILDEIGRMILDMMIKAGYFIIAVTIIKDILSCVSKRDTEGIIKAILSGVVGFGAILMVEKILDRVKDVLR